MAQKLEMLQKLLNKIAAEHKYENHELIINEISSGGANYTSKLFTVIIREENKKDLHLFAKIAALGEEARSEMPTTIYDTEQFAYNKLSKIYASLEDENGVPEENRLYLTKCYGLDASRNQEILILENLVALGYGLFERFHSYDWEYASSAISDLAKMHALSFAFSKKDPKEFEKTLVALKMESKHFEIMNNIMQKLTTVALDNVKPEFREALEKFMENKKNPFSMVGAIGSPVIIHGDFRGDNLVHRVREDGKVEIKILDLQTLQGGSPVTDLIYFIMTGSDSEFRAKYYEKLLDHYYTQLSAAMKRLNLDPEETFSRKDFEYELREKMPYGLCVAVFTLPIVTIDSKDAPTVNESTEISDITFDKTSELYKLRLNEVVSDYVKWGVLKL